MSFNPRTQFHKHALNSISEVFEYFKNHFLVSVLLKVEKEHGRLYVNPQESSVTGLGFDATLLQELIFVNREILVDFGIAHVGTYAIDAVFKLKEDEYVFQGAEITAKLH